MSDAGDGIQSQLFAIQGTWPKKACAALRRQQASSDVATIASSYLALLLRWHVMTLLVYASLDISAIAFRPP